MDEALPPEENSIARESLVDASGRRFKDFRRGLTPRFGRVWLDIAAGHVCLWGAAIGLVVLHGMYPSAWPVLAPLGALVIGYWLAYIVLFFHEAAHYNIAPTRAGNDLLANLAIGLLIGGNIRSYRLIHFDHHRHLGTTSDTERSYFDALNVRFIVESLTGIKVLRVLLLRQRKLATNRRTPERSSLLLLGTLLLHLSIVGASAYFRIWPLLLAWPLGVGAVFPFVTALRQLLEHRSADARSNVDYGAQPHGPVTRSFGTGPLASTLGGAGFNRHFLHHWEPQISYTRLAELEDYLMDTEAAALVRANRTTYLATFARLMRAP